MLLKTQKASSSKRVSITPIFERYDGSHLIPVDSTALHFSRRAAACE